MGKKILFIDDHVATRSAVAFILTNAGYEVVPFTTAEEAAEHLRHTDVHIALIDVQLPGRHGDDFAGDFHAQWPRIPVILWTAEADIDKVKHVAPFALVLRKPVDMPALLELIDCELAKSANAEEPPDTLKFPSAG
ncbi:MAG: response regulator [Phycisphaerae bacterium]